MSTGIVAGTRVNFRSSADSKRGDNIIKTLSKGVRVEINNDLIEWYEITIEGGQRGFVKSSFVNMIGTFNFVGGNAIAPDGTIYAKKFRRGVFNNGTTSIGEFVNKNYEIFTGLAPSNLHIMQAVSENEGKLEAINTWDNAFMTFGIFQWTAGANGAGELPPMIARLKQRSPEKFQQYFGQFGLDVTGIVTQPDVLPLGFFSLNKIKLETAAQKEKLRTLDWAYRFWLAGHDDTVRQVQIEHAIERVKLFYKNAKAKIKNYFIADYVTSEFGVALILDQHVNRPGHVLSTLSSAVAQLDDDNPSKWNDMRERELINIYINIRAKTNMTDSKKRADTVRKAVAVGMVSDKRGSYQMSH